ncbi:MAG: DUF2628 domain-containing protein [Acetobacteraceae bacterium]|nr:DUF2628 domain-containing protein [Acetobacteraceae bacterium]
MKIWTAHEKPHAPPLLIREGFSCGALVFGPFWLASHRAWLSAAVALLLEVLIPVLTRPPASLVLTAGFAVWLGFSGRDLVRWCIARRGYLESSVIAGRNEDEAQVRLLTARPDLVVRSMVAEAAP